MLPSRDLTLEGRSEVAMPNPVGYRSGLAARMVGGALLEEP